MDRRTGTAAGSGSRRRIGITVGAVVLLTGTGWWFLHSPRGGAVRARFATSTGWQLGPAGKTSLGPISPEAADEQRPAPPPRFDETTCWRDLDRFNDGVTIDNFRSWSAALLASQDEHVLSYLKERLTELIGADAGRAGAVLGWVRDSSPKEAGVFLSALRGAEAVHLPAVAAQLTTMSLDSSIPLERRAGLLSALDTQKRFAPAVLGQLTELAKSPDSGDAGWAATRTIGRVMATDAKRTGNAAPYLDKLLTIGSESTDDEVRYLALSMPMHTDPILDAQATDRYAKILTTEGSANGRDAAANILALGEDKAKVLAIFARAFPAESDVCARWALFRFAARAAGKDALPVMAEMAAIDPRFQDDYQIFAQIYQSGVVDFERVWLALPSQDPHDCLHRPD